MVQYHTIVDSLLDAVPEIRERYNALQNEIGPDVLPYPVFELVLEPFVKRMLTSANDNLLRRAFGFLEEMAEAHDVEIANLLAISIFEPWVADPQTLARAWKHMGKSMKEIASDTAHRLKRGKNVPHA